MGGADLILERAESDLEQGEYQFVATALNHVVFAEPDNIRAKAMLAKTYRLMAGLTETGPHRNFYLSAAHELDNGVDERVSMRTVGADTVRAIPLDIYFDLLAVRFNAAKAEGKKWQFNFNVTTTKDGVEVQQKALLFVSNGALHSRMGVNSDQADATLEITRDGLDRLNLKQSGILRLVVTGDASIGGNPLALRDFFTLVEDPDPAFNIVTP